MAARQPRIANLVETKLEIVLWLIALNKAISNNIYIFFGVELGHFFSDSRAVLNNADSSQNLLLRATAQRC